MCVVCIGALNTTAEDKEKDTSDNIPVTKDEIQLQVKLREAAQLFERGKVKEAITIMDALVTKHPDDIRVLAVRGQMYEANLQFKNAIDDFTKVIKTEPTESYAYHLRGVCYFNTLNFKQSVKDFDRFIMMNPAREPYQWQRGISHYYAKMYAKGEKQFEIHKKVNPNDVENAVWQYLCVAKLRGIKAARENFMPIQGDKRIPLMQIHALFAGKSTPKQVLEAAEHGVGAKSDLAIKTQRFYAHLYLGLYHHAHDEMQKAREHIKLAATKYFIPGYMGNVARVHHNLYLQQDKKKITE